MFERITSLQNERVKAIRALDMRKTRKDTGLFVAEGVSILMTAREHGFVPASLVVGPEGAATRAASDYLHWAHAGGADVLDVSAGVLEKLAAKDNPQSMLGVFRQRWLEGPQPSTVPTAAFWIVLEGIRDPGNLGTILRTADAVGAAGVMLVGQTCDPFSREAVRATMGSIFAVPLVKLDQTAFLTLLSAWPGDTVATHLSATLDFRAARPRGPVLLVMGAEGPGLNDVTRAACSLAVKIPMAGGVDSFNLAIATALVAYQLQGATLKA